MHCNAYFLVFLANRPVFDDGPVFRSGPQPVSA